MNATLLFDIRMAAPCWPSAWNASQCVLPEVFFAGYCGGGLAIVAGMIMSGAFEQYRELRNEVDRQMESLLACHGDNITCKPGCAECCVNLTAFAVEYYYILSQLRQAEITELHFDDGAPCGYLNADNRCVLYEHRPMICRTHGLPIAFLNDECSPAEYSVSFCPDNFTQAEPEELAFGPDNTLNIDRLNAALWEANVAFLNEHPELDLEPGTRIPMRNLQSDLRQEA